MKYLTNYIEDKQSELFNKLGIFFAFSKEQFKEGYEKANGKERGKYTDMTMGMFCPSKHVDEFLNHHHTIVTDGIAQDMEENGKEGVIRRELYNHEATYTHSYESTIDALQGYPISVDEIKEAYSKLIVEEMDANEREYETKTNTE